MPIVVFSVLGCSLVASLVLALFALSTGDTRKEGARVAAPTCEERGGKTQTTHISVYTGTIHMLIPQYHCEMPKHAGAKEEAA